MKNRRLTFFSLIVLILSASFAEAQFVTPQGKTKREAQLVELVDLDKTIKLDIRYARSDNFVGRVVYPEARAFLQKPAAEAVVKVHQKLKKQGLGLVIFDGYRPWAITKLFWEVTPEDKRKFVANPAKGSKHNRGCAVDLSLFDLKTGKLLEMPSDFDEFTDRASPNYQGGTPEQTKNRDLLRKLMEAEGFTVNDNEWWHFDYKDWEDYAIYDVSFAAISQSKEQLSKPEIKEDKTLKRFFEEAGVTGGIVVYDLQKNLLTVFDKKRSETSFSPASTSKIIHSLIFLDAGVLKDEAEIIKWDGTKNGIEAWNQDHDLRSAYRVSALPFYLEVSKRMTREAMQKYYDLSNYGNRSTDGFGTAYWVKGDLRITPREQIAFLVRLHENRLPFAPQVIEKVKNIMVEEKNNDYILRAKTGWSDAYSPQIGWWVGYIEKKENAYFFATEIDIKKNEDAAQRREITRKILTQLGIIK